MAQNLAFWRFGAYFTAFCAFWRFGWAWEVCVLAFWRFDEDHPKRTVGAERTMRRALCFTDGHGYEEEAR